MEQLGFEGLARRALPAPLVALCNSYRECRAIRAELETPVKELRAREEEIRLQWQGIKTTEQRLRTALDEAMHERYEAEKPYNEVCGMMQTLTSEITKLDKELHGELTPWNDLVGERKEGER